MKKGLFIIGVTLVGALGATGFFYGFYGPSQQEPAPEPYDDYIMTEAGFEEVVDVPLSQVSEEELREIVRLELENTPFESDGRIRWSLYWRDFTETEAQLYGSKRRDPGPITVGVQVGHWQNNDVPDELSGLTRNGSGAQGGGTTEVEVVYDIAVLLKDMLEAEGIVVELLPTTIPIDYYADAFVSIHADGNENTTVSGFKIAGPRNDHSGRSVNLVSELYDAYEAETGLRRDENITRRMSGYYAFNWRRYDHALHPMTPAAIVETGFLTSPADRDVIVAAPERVASGIAQGLLSFFEKYPVVE